MRASTKWFNEFLEQLKSDVELQQAIECLCARLAKGDQFAEGEVNLLIQMKQSRDEVDQLLGIEGYDHAVAVIEGDKYLKQREACLDACRTSEENLKKLVAKNSLAYKQQKSIILLVAIIKYINKYLDFFSCADEDDIVEQDLAIMVGIACMKKSNMFVTQEKESLLNVLTYTDFFKSCFLGLVSAEEENAILLHSEKESSAHRAEFHFRRLRQGNTHHYHRSRVILRYRAHKQADHLNADSACAEEQPATGFANSQ